MRQRPHILAEGPRRCAWISNDHARAPARPKPALRRRGPQPDPDPVVFLGRDGRRSLPGAAASPRTRFSDGLLRFRKPRSAGNSLHVAVLGCRLLRIRSRRSTADGKVFKAAAAVDARRKPGRCVSVPAPNRFAISNGKDCRKWLRPKDRALSLLLWPKIAAPTPPWASGWL